MRDLTQGKPVKVIIMFMIPMLIGNLFQQLYSTIDMMIIGQTLGTNALAAIGATHSIVFLVFGFVIGLTSGLNILTAQNFGARDMPGVRRSFATGIVIAGIVTLIVTVAASIFLRPILDLMRTPPEIIEYAHSFMTVVFYGIVAFVAFQLLSNTLRAIGDAKTPLYALIVLSLVNIALVYLFVVVLGMGIFSAGLGIILSAAAGSLFLLIHIHRNVPNLKINRSDFNLTKHDLWSHAKVAFPMAFQTSIIAIGTIIIQIAINTLGTDAVAANAAGMRIDQLIILPLLSFSITLSTFTAQNYGAKKFDRISQGVKEGMKFGIGFTVLAGLSMILWGADLAMLFFSGDYPNVYALLQTYFLIHGATYWLLAMKFMVRSALQGIGKTMIPTIGGVLELIIRVLGVVLLTAPLGFVGIALVNPLAWVVGSPYLVYHAIKELKKLSKLQKATQTTIQEESLEMVTE